MPPTGRIADVAEVLNRKFDEVKQLARKTLYSAVISAGGLLVRDNGEVKVQNTNGYNMFYLGPLTQGGVLFRGMLLQRENGQKMFANGVADSDPDKIFFAWLDNAQNTLFSDDGSAGIGIARPWLSMPTVPVLSTSIPVHQSASFTSVYSTGWILKQQPNVEVQALLYSTGGGVGEARFTANGSPIGSTITINNGDFVWTPVTSLALPGAYGTYVRVELQTRRTNGAGSVGGVLVASQRQSV